MDEREGARRICNRSDFERVRLAAIAANASKKTWISVCGGTSCSASRSRPLREALQKAITENKLHDVGIRLTGCHGFCEHGPLVVISPEGICYEKVKPEDASEIVEQSVVKAATIERLLYVDPQTKEKIRLEKDIPFYKRQTRILLAGNKLIDSTRIEDYFAIGGYRALVKVLTEMSPEQVIAEIKHAGLRGRGGAGFPTGAKWETCRSVPGDIKYVICNADEGDPGAYMDRSVLEGNPHSVLEGMMIGAYAIGAAQGIVYVRIEYPLAIQHLKIAIEVAREHGLLGKNIFGSGFNFDVQISQGAGAFVCGEETALIASVEGRTGEPRQRPPFPAQRGLWSKPTNINNVETWACVPQIIDRGAGWFSSIGTETSKGTKLFSSVGQVRNTGLVEVPMGLTLREMVFEIGGGVFEGRKFKAVQTGGPSGGCIPEQLLHLPVDYEKLAEAGAIMGSGGMIVMDDRTCMVDVARYFLDFLSEESCGKCLACREGITRLLEILNKICAGEGLPGDIELLEELAQAVKDFSLCGLGGTAPNPVLTTLRYFREEYIAHIDKKKCPAGVCKALISYRILEGPCTGCGACRRPCPAQAIKGEKKQLHAIDTNVCVKCGMCKDICKFDAVLVE